MKYGTFVFKSKERAVQVGNLAERLTWIDLEHIVCAQTRSLDLPNRQSFQAAGVRIDREVEATLTFRLLPNWINQMRMLLQIHQHHNSISTIRRAY